MKQFDGIMHDIMKEFTDFMLGCHYNFHHMIMEIWTAKGKKDMSHSSSSILNKDNQIETIQNMVGIDTIKL